MSARRGPIVGLALAAYVALLVVSAPAWPDDWDGVGFLESMTDFDLARFHPHPPGYPVYVALLRAAALLCRAPMRAAVIVAALCNAAAVAFVAGAVRRVASERAAWMAALLIAVTPLTWRAGSGVGSEAPALACAAACAFGVVAEGPTAAVALGLGVGLGLGVRLSWAPLYLAALALAGRLGSPRVWQARAIGALACAAWLIPFVALVGPAKLVSLTETHGVGHALRWGGTVLTQPGGARFGWLARDVLVDGLGVDSDPLGFSIAALLCATTAVAGVAWRASGWAGWRSALVSIGPYAVWVGLGQNVRDQPRHALPLVVALAAGLALVSGTSRRAMGLVGALTLLVSVRTALDSTARRSVPPPGEQLVELARKQAQPDRLGVFGVSSVRFFEPTELAPHAFAASTVDDVEARLSRLDVLPERVWVTSEVGGRDSSRWPFVAIASLCRPPRIDRRAPCLDVFEWKVPFRGPSTSPGN